MIKEHDVREVATPGSMQLYRARIMLDLSMMCMFRDTLTLYMTWGLNAAWAYLFCDGSPASGFESFACVETLFFTKPSPLVVHHKLPMTYLGYGHMRLQDKIFSLLWAYWLECGGDVSRMRWRLSIVRAICTDQGVESGLADAPDMLPFFYRP